MLLDADLSLKVADFGGSSLNGSKSLICGGVRYYVDDVWKGPTTPRMDYFALGSTIYEIMTGTSPYEEVNSKDVQPLFDSKTFPDLSGVPCGDLAEKCWRDEIDSAQEVYLCLKSRLLEAKI